MEKQCNKCRRVLPVSSLVPSKRYKGGYRPFCHDCKSLENKKYRDPNYVKQVRPKGYYSTKPGRKPGQTNRSKLLTGIQILIKYGYCKTEEEARKYANC